MKKIFPFVLICTILSCGSNNSGAPVTTDSTKNMDTTTTIQMQKDTGEIPGLLPDTSSQFSDTSRMRKKALRMEKKALRMERKSIRDSLKNLQ